MRSALPLGVVARTIKIDRANLLCFSELAQHQLSVGILASGAGKESFYAGLFHDIYKPAMRWESGKRGWWWRHLPGSAFPEFKERFREILAPLDGVVDVERVADICAGHHSVKGNPIHEIEPRIAVMLEVRAPLAREAMRPAHELASFDIRSPYRAFVASLFIEKLLSRVNEAYSRFLSEEFGLKELHVRYEFTRYDESFLDPRVSFDDGALSVEVPVRSPPGLEGFTIEHHYLPTPDVRPSLEVSERDIKLNLRFSDVLTFTVTEEYGASFWAIAPVKDLGRGQELRVRLARLFEEAKEKALDDLLSVKGLKRELADELRSSLLDELTHYRPARPGVEKCMFCGAEASFRVTKGRLERFVDVDRIVAFTIMACAPCRLAYAVEDARRMTIPICITPLPALPIKAEALEEFTEYVVQGFSIPTHVLPPVKTALEEPWAKIVSWAFYYAVLSDPDEFGLRRLRRNPITPLFRYFLTRTVMLYPFIFEVRPIALMSAWTSTGKKKFILNVDTTSGFIVLPGAERDLTVEDLEVLKPLAGMDEKVLQKAYRALRLLYELG